MGKERTDKDKCTTSNIYIGLNLKEKKDEGELATGTGLRHQLLVSTGSMEDSRSKAASREPSLL